MKMYSTRSTEEQEPQGKQPIGPKGPHVHVVRELRGDRSEIDVAFRGLSPLLILTLDISSLRDHEKSMTVHTPDASLALPVEGKMNSRLH